MHKSVSLNPLFHGLYKTAATITGILRKMSAILSVGQVGLKIRRKMAFRHLQPLYASPLASTRHIVRKGKNTLRPFSAVITIPIDSYEHTQDVPSERVLSRLSILNLWRNIPNDHTDCKIEPSGTSQEAQRQEREAQKTARRRRQEEAQKWDTDTATGDPFPGVDVECGGGGCTTKDQSEHEGHGSKGADTGTGTDASVPDYSGGYNGGYDGGGWDGGSGCDSGC